MGNDIQLRTTNTNNEINDRHYEDFIPGTFNIYTTLAQDSDDTEHEGPMVKTKGNIILMPQPSSSPNDPLNWSVFRKFLNFTILAVITGFTAATSNDAGAVQDALNVKYGISYDSMNTGAGILFASIGIGTFVLTPLASIYGRKVSYFICIFLGLLGAVWFGHLDDITDVIWSQLFIGVSESCAEAQVQLSLSDLYFQHQLGSVLTGYILATSIGTFLGPMLAGFISDGIGFRWVGWIGTIISGGLLIVILFLMEETYFDRGAVRKSVRDKIMQTKSYIYNEKQNLQDNTSEKGSLSDIVSVDDDGINDPPNSYWRNVQLITPATNIIGTGFLQYCKRLRMLTRVFLYPPVIFSGLVWGIQDALLTFYITVEEDDYYNPPYNYTNKAVAIMNVPTLIGAIIGCVYAGIISDYASIWMAKRNNGIQEAEYRLWFLILPAIICPPALVCFGIGTDRGWSWVPNYIALGVIGFGFGSSGDVSMSYLMDAYPEMIIEMMCGVAVINNLLGCIFTFCCSPMLAALGNSKGFGVMAAFEFAIMISAIPMMIYGKRTRIWTKAWYLEYCTLRDAI